MKRTLQFLAIGVAATGLAIWATKGASLGWTKTQVQVKTIDEVTEIEKIEWQKQFLPGVDFLGVTMVTAGALAGAALFLSRKTQTKKQEPQKV